MSKEIRNSIFNLPEGGSSGSSWTPQYYVSNTGNDALDGLTPLNAWKTIAKVNASSFVAGDKIGFKKDGVWRETLVVPSSGDVGNPITFGVYPNGNAEFNGMDVVDDGLWAADTGWQEGATIVRVGSQGNYTDINARNIIPANTYSNGTKIRVSIKATGGNSTIKGLSIGVMTTGSTFDSAPTRITFDGGNPGCTINSGTTKVSDEITFVFDKTKRYGLHTFADIFHLSYSSNGSRYYAGDFTDRSQSLTYPGSSGPVAGWESFDQIEIYGGVEDVYNAVYPLVSPNVVLRNGSVMTKALSKATLNDNEWFFSGGVLSYKDLSGSPIGIEASTRKYLLSTNGKSNVVISNNIKSLYGDAGRFCDNYLENIFGISLGEPTALVSDDGMRMDVWSTQKKYSYTYDGLKFAAPVDMVFDGDNAAVNTAHMMKVGNTYYYYARKFSDGKMYLFTGTDRIHFTEVGEVLSNTIGSWDYTSVWNMFVWHEGDNWFMLYEGGGGFAIGLATASAPEGPWTKYGITPVIPGGIFATGQPEMMRVNNEIIKKDGKYYLYHYGDSINKILRSWSTDLHIWTLEGIIFNNRAIHSAPYITFEDFCFCQFKGKSYMFFTPSSQVGTYHVDCLVDNRPLAALLALTP